MLLCASAFLFVWMLAACAGKKTGAIVLGEVEIKPQGSYFPDFDRASQDDDVRNVILMIGDGMGLGVVTSALYANGGELTMTNLRAIGYVETSAVDKAITDSPASGTAFATGQKTKYGFIGIDSEGRALMNIPEILSARGIHCGIVTSDLITGSTPAAFYAHCKSREDKGRLWDFLSDSRLDFAAGGTMEEYEALDDVLQERIRSRFKVISATGDIDCERNILLLPERVGLPERGSYLSDVTHEALSYLQMRSSDSGFFLMVEGGRIDIRGHCKDYPDMVLETLDFDKAVAEAVKYAEKDRHTLVIITADHETAGVVLQDVTDGKVLGGLSASYHTPTIVPLFAFGPHSEEFCCLQSNSDVGQKIIALYSEINDAL